MKIVLVGINAKYVQTNLAIRLLKGYAEKTVAAVKEGRISLEIREWNINQPYSAAVRGVFESGADIVLFSTYIWNREMVFKCIGDIRKVMPNAVIGLGGPEVSWSSGQTFADCPGADFIISGEGELSFAEVCERSASALFPDFSGIQGVYTRDSQVNTEVGIQFGGPRAPIENLDIIPFPYFGSPLDFNPENRIVYYESSRGCPFSCAYCLSSIDKSVRYYPLERVLNELKFFIDSGYPLVKFVDRTFNLDPARYLAIWTYIRDHHNGKTLFHFEISAEYLSDEAFDLLNTLPEGAVQFEIGIQSINSQTLEIVGRPSHPDLLAAKIRRIPRTIHTHVDLIAGLPAEDAGSFACSFNFAYGLDADMLQLGFLKVLAGTPMEAIANDRAEYIWSDVPPYEILATPVLSYENVLVLKDVEHVVDTWFNSALMRNTLNHLALTDPACPPFSLFRELTCFIRNFFPDGDLYLPRRTSDSFSCMAAFLKGRAAGDGKAEREALEYLRYDFLLQGKPGVFPVWFERRYSKVIHDRFLEEQGFLVPEGVSRRTVYSRTEYEEFFFRPGEKKEAILFVYPEAGEKEKKVKILKL